MEMGQALPCMTHWLLLRLPLFLSFLLTLLRWQNGFRGALGSQLVPRGVISHSQSVSQIPGVNRMCLCSYVGITLDRPLGQNPGDGDKNSLFCVDFFQILQRSQMT